MALGGCAMWGIYNGLGHHLADLGPSQIAVQYKLLIAADITWLLGTVSAKLSMLYLYTRIFAISRATKVGALILMLLVTSFGIAFLVIFMTQCHPFDEPWNPVPGGWCRNLVTQEYISCGLNLVLDLSVVILPMPVLWKLQMTTTRKLFITIMFSLGLVTVGVMCWRLQYTAESVVINDYTFTLGTISTISMFELWLGIICVCLPTLGPLVKIYVSPAISKMTSGAYFNRLIRGSRMWSWFTPNNSGRQSTKKERQDNNIPRSGFQRFRNPREPTDTELLQDTVYEFNTWCEAEPPVSSDRQTA
ncbi:hypothetical protein VMCG_09090 [Cytospora schulzeri]|uniref:Rhodopsin domain-containing protein n=1 Tax=Cytospora schulzeri TaxID=448051 RepID=A0A423VP69_9PEZI|nr:hypothetical protein VMCG_09090 [Valsa malicola]